MTTAVRLGATDFHAGRIARLRETRRTFTPPVDWDPQADLQRGFGMFRGGQDVLALLRTTPSCLGGIIQSIQRQKQRALWPQTYAACI